MIAVLSVHSSLSTVSLAVRPRDISSADNRVGQDGGEISLVRQSRNTSAELSGHTDLDLRAAVCVENARYRPRPVLVPAALSKVDGERLEHRNKTLRAFIERDARRGQSDAI